MTQQIRPAHYGGADNPYEVIKVLEAWNPLCAYWFCIGNSVKYIARAGKKDPSKTIEDLQKAATYSELAVGILGRHASINFGIGEGM